MKFIQGVTNYDEWRDHAKDNEKYKERMALISELLPKKNDLNVIDQYRLANALVISSLTGKLEDFWAISTSVLMNQICQARARLEGCICAECYAAANCARWTNLAQSLETNFLILNNFLLDEDVLATIPFPSTNGCGRIESHGDVATEICAINYVRFIRSHKYLVFAVWTKNLNLYRNVLEAEGKPDNMIIIASSPMENVVMELPEWAKKYVDHIFTVYTPEYAKEHNIAINCGTWEGHDLDHRCKKCMRCYTKGNADYYISELKK